MNWTRPKCSELLRAIDAYLAVAYDHAVVSKLVTAKVDALRALTDDTVFASKHFEADVPADPTRFALRLGNAAYPHMKLVVERAPDGLTHLFRADTHDRHVQPKPGTPDHDAFVRLMGLNQQFAERIEAAWEAAGVPTFKGYLRRDLARRAAAAAAVR